MNDIGKIMLYFECKIFQKQATSSKNFKIVQRSKPASIRIPIIRKFQSYQWQFAVLFNDNDCIFRNNSSSSGNGNGRVVVVVVVE